MIVFPFRFVSIKASYWGEGCAKLLTSGGLWIAPPGSAHLRLKHDAQIQFLICG
jgi:hypothetical protein